jgi:acetoacetate decarboxylase
VTSLTAEAESFDDDRRLFSAVHPVVSPALPEGPAQAKRKSYAVVPTDNRRDAVVVPLPLQAIAPDAGGVK